MTRYLLVFAALLVLTVATVAVSALQLSPTAGIAVGLTIAFAKATLVALFFMHLLHERRIVYISLAFTAIFFVALIGLTLWTEAYHVPGTEFSDPFSR